jgi:integrase
LKTRSIAAVRGNLRRYLSALHYTGFVVASVRDLREVVDFAVFERAMTWFLERNGGETLRSIGETAWTVRVLAVKYLGVDEETERLFGNAVSRLRVRHSGLSPKNRVALAQFDDPEAVQRFLLVPDRLWEKAENASGKKARLRAETAVATELLIYAPIRFTNLRTIRIDEHLSWIGERLHLHFVEHEVKNSEPLHFILPTFVGRRIREFLDRYHGEYLNEPNLHLFAGRNGRPKDESCLRKQIKRSLFDETGIEMTPHQFRHVAAKLLLDNMPGHYEVVRKMLGHKKLSTVYEAYSGAETQAALDMYDSVILRLKHGESGDHGHGAHDRPGTGATKPRHASPTSSPFMDPFNPTGKGRKTR